MSNEYPYASMRDSFDLSAYFVVGPEDCKGRPLTDVVDQALRGGATFIQLRAKEADASELTDMARDIAQIIEDNEKSDSVAFVIDDRADVVWQARRKGIKVDGTDLVLRMCALSRCLEPRAAMSTRCCLASFWASLASLALVNFFSVASEPGFAAPS